MADDLNEEHDRSQPGDRSEEVLDVTETVMLDADNVGGNEDNHGTGRSCVDICGRREKTGDQADQVGYEHKDRKSCNQREKRAAMLTHRIDNHGFDAADNGLHEILHATRYGLERRRCQQRKHEK